jgi:hypothetical protein
LLTAVPFSAGVLADAQLLPHGRNRAGDRHLKFYETRDNLLDEAVRELLADPDVQYFHTKSGRSNDRRNAASTPRFLKNLRNALSHPRTIRSDVWTTGYETDEDESGLIRRVTFINSPDVTSSAEPSPHRLKEDPCWDISKAGFWTMVVPTSRLGYFVEGVALTLAQPALGNWDQVPPLVPDRSRSSR